MRNSVLNRSLLVLLMAALSVSLRPVDAAPASGAAAATFQDPSELIKSVAHTLLEEVGRHRGEYRGSPHELEQVIGATLLPRLDLKLIARLVLGRHWATADPGQRQRFIAAFTHSLLRTYGTALLDFSAERLRVLPFRGDVNARRATVHTIVRRNDGTPVHVDYELLRTPQGWQAFDVVVEGVSYVASFRADYNAEVRDKGLDELIARLQKQS